VTPRILVAGIGNIFLGDDAFGSEVARQLMHCGLPAEVRVVDFGIRSYDLGQAIASVFEAVIMVDATSRGQPPGTVYLIEPDLAKNDDPNELVNAHGLTSLEAVQLARSKIPLGGRVFLVGCEPAVLESEEGQLGLSAEVNAAVPQAIEMIESLISDLLKETDCRNESRVL
jgi:hydrogenase maturation protease